MTTEHVEEKHWLKENYGTLFRVVILVVVALLSATLVAGKACSKDAKVTKACIRQLDKQRNEAEGLTGSALGLSVAVGLLPGDIGSGIAGKLADISGYLLIALCAIFLEKYLLTVFAFLAFRILIPVGCALLLASLFFQGFWKKLGVRLIIYGLVLYLLVPASLFVSARIQAFYHDSYEETLDMAEDSTEKAREEIKKETETDSSTRGSSDSSKSDNILEKAREVLSGAASDLSDAAEGLSDAAAGLTERAEETLDSAQETLNRMLEYVAIMIVTSCLIPILVLFLLVSLTRVILGISPDFSFPPSRSR